MAETTKRYKHRVLLPAHIAFYMVSEVGEPTQEQLLVEARQHIYDTADFGGFHVDGLDWGRVYVYDADFGKGAMVLHTQEVDGEAL